MSLKKESRSNFVVFPSLFFEIEIISLNIQKEESNNSLLPILFQPFTSSFSLELLRLQLIFLFFSFLSFPFLSFSFLLFSFLSFVFRIKLNVIIIVLIPSASHDYFVRLS